MHRPVSAFFLLLVLFLAASCGEKSASPGAGGPPKRPPVPVLTAKARNADVPVELRANGVVEAVQSSPVRAQIGGLVTAAGFREGDKVRAGQVLYEIDAQPIEATLRQLNAERNRVGGQIRAASAQYELVESQNRITDSQARAAEAQAKTAEAQAAHAAAQAERYAALVEKGYVTREQYDQAVTAARAAQSNLEASRAAAEAARTGIEGRVPRLLAAKAAIESAQEAKGSVEATIENATLQLGYTKVRAPVSGQAGSLLVKPGDLVKANGDSPMVVINQIHPILVKFALPEGDFPRLQKHRKEGALTVTAELPGGERRKGTLVFVDNAVDRATGTIAAKARFENADEALWPGQFLDVRLGLAVLKDAVVVPPAAVQTGQKGPYVYVVDAEGAAVYRPVKPGLATPDAAVVEEGLAAGETVVVDGHVKLTPGAKIVAKDSLGAAPVREASR